MGLPNFKHNNITDGGNEWFRGPATSLTGEFGVNGSWYYGGGPVLLGLLRMAYGWYPGVQLNDSRYVYGFAQI